jgi:hypothetical protein
MFTTFQYQIVSWARRMQSIHILFKFYFNIVASARHPRPWSYPPPGPSWPPPSQPAGHVLVLSTSQNVLATSASVPSGIETMRNVQKSVEHCSAFQRLVDRSVRLYKGKYSSSLPYYIAWSRLVDRATRKEWAITNCDEDSSSSGVVTREQLKRSLGIQIKADSFTDRELIKKIINYNSEQNTLISDLKQPTVQ